ncbi:VOC family protein [Thalassotalea sp. 1_MG-2023]|uniref:VOC family protein n=1 Tax=Thalassotalea sp. 1_MG-2023 TaxID=3062680 RepID=UPI0026E2C5BB|nr:VOC family protein [Thalassotalea sp. 1_MG-2023]MDO6426025.1 VOC family protein [Thalassotalea sp. 1_MG-2023]
MVHLEHINLVVKDIPETLTFYQAAFPHWHIRGRDTQTWYGKKRQWLHFGDDYQYLTFNDGGTGENRNLQGATVGLAHFAFVTNNLQALITRLETAGFERTSSGEVLTQRKNAYFIDPNGFEVEFVEYTSDIPQERNKYQESQKHSQELNV